MHWPGGGPVVATSACPARRWAAVLRSTFVVAVEFVRLVPGQIAATPAALRPGAARRPAWLRRPAWPLRPAWPRQPWRLPGPWPARDDVLDHSRPWGPGGGGADGGLRRSGRGKADGRQGVAGLGAALTGRQRPGPTGGRPARRGRAARGSRRALRRPPRRLRPSCAGWADFASDELEFVEGVVASRRTVATADVLMCSRLTSPRLRS